MESKLVGSNSYLPPDRSLAAFQEEPPKGTMRRYMSLEKFFDFALNSRLTFSRISEFEDKSEGYETAEVLKSDTAYFLDDLYDKGARKSAIDDLRSELASCKTRGDLINLLERAQETPVNPPLTGELVYQLNAISQRIERPASKRWFCLCFSHKEAEDYLLWSAYTRGRLGVCVEFSPKELAAQLSIFGYTPGNEGFTERFSKLLLGPVSYRKDLRINPSASEEDYIFTKSDHFSGEQEFRIAGRVSIFGMRAKNFHMKLSDVTKVISGVSISPFYSPWEADAVKKVIQTIFEKEHGKAPIVRTSTVTMRIE